MDQTTTLVQLPECDVLLRDDGILEYTYTINGQVQLELAERVVAAAAGLVDQPVPTLIHIDKVAGVSRDARLYFAESKENQAVSSRVALIIDSPLSRIIANFFMGLNKRQLPTRMFNRTDDAIAWLLER